MKASDIVAAVLFGGFGLWCVVFPKSVLRVYKRLPMTVSGKPSQVRIAGAVWVILVIVIFAFTFMKN